MSFSFFLSLLIFCLCGVHRNHPPQPKHQTQEFENTICCCLLFRSAGNYREAAYLDDDSPGVNVDESPTRKVFGAGCEGLVQTPSPSDSGVGELEAMLREREAEISTLRQVMDRNERAIFQVGFFSFV